MKPLGGESGPMKLSVIVPVYNEADTVCRILDRVAALDVALELLIVDDGSTDGTTERVERWARDKPFAKVLRHETNRGKGAAIRTAQGHVTGDAVVIQDADLEYDPRDFMSMLELVRAGADVVYGSRVRARQPYAHLRYYLGGRLLSAVANLLYRTKLTDEPTCYKMFRAELFRSLELVSEGFDFCPEVTARVALSGVRIHEVPISYRPRSIRQGKKIRWRDGLRAIWVLVRYRFFGPRRRKALHNNSRAI